MAKTTAERPAFNKLSADQQSNAMYFMGSLISNVPHAQLDAAKIQELRNISIDIALAFDQE